MYLSIYDVSGTRYAPVRNAKETRSLYSVFKELMASVTAPF